MTSSPTERPATDSPSSQQSPQGQQPVTAPPLRVTAPVSPPIPSPTTIPPAAGGGFSGGELPPDPIEAAPPDTGTRSSGDGPAAVELPGSMREVAAAVVAGASLGAAHAIARGDDELADVLTATDDEVAGISAPLAKVAGRKVKIAAGSSDGADLIVAGFAAIAYVIRAGWAAWSLHRSRRALAKATGDPVETAPAAA